MTPLQKLIKQFEELKDSNLESSIDVGFAISLIKSMLEEEKEVIIDAWLDDRFPLDKEWAKKCAEQYYNQTFNTKEK